MHLEDIGPHYAETLARWRANFLQRIDAVRALAWVRLVDRETVRIALQSTLIKNAADIPLFDEQFDLLFGLTGFRLVALHGSHAGTPFAEDSERLIVEGEVG